jgi:hypothetical protein
MPKGVVFHRLRACGSTSGGVRENRGDVLLGFDQRDDRADDQSH